MRENDTVQHAHEAVLGNLCAVLDKEAGLYAELLAILKAKKDCLVTLQMEKLKAVIAEEDRIVFEIAASENAKRGALRKAAQLLMVPDEAVTLKDIMLKCPEPFRTKLIFIRKTLSAGIAELSRANKMNVTLVRQSLDHVKTFLHLLVGAEAEKEVYGRRGQNGYVRAAKNFVDHVA